MDFRDRHPNLKYWPYTSFAQFEDLFPYNLMIGGRFHTLVAFDQSTVFRVLLGELTNDESQWRSYAVEAPPSSPMCQALDDGEVSWSDFMAHRNWVIEFTHDFNSDQDIRVRYVPPSQISPYYTSQLTNLDGRGGPYQILHDKYLKSWEIQKQTRPTYTGGRDRYLNFVEKCGDRFKGPKKAA